MMECVYNLVRKFFNKILLFEDNIIIIYILSAFRRSEQSTALKIIQFNNPLCDKTIQI